MEPVCPLLPDGLAVGPQIPVKSACLCRSRQGRTMPLWEQTQTADAVRRQLQGVLQPDMILFTYRCPDCKRKVVMSLGTLFGLE